MTAPFIMSINQIESRLTLCYSKKSESLGGKD